MTVRAPGIYKLAIGDTIFLTPEAENLHKFDETGLRIN
jgi:multiple sugar transport system ATP-binding protein